MPKADRIRAMFAAWERGDFASHVELYDDDVQFSGAQPEGQVEARGPEGIRGFMRRFLADWGRYTVELHELEELDDCRFLATATQHGTGTTSGMDITAPAHIAIRMSDDRITQIEF